VFCGEVTGTVFVIGVVIKIQCDKKGVLNVGWECTYSTDPIISEVIENIFFGEVKEIFCREKKGG
jgi:hypothetical protein